MVDETPHRGRNESATGPPDHRWWTIAEATQITGLTYWQLRYATRHGRIRSEQLGGGVLLLDPDDVVRFAQMKGAASVRRRSSHAVAGVTDRQHSTRGDG